MHSCSGAKAQATDPKKATDDETDETTSKDNSAGKQAAKKNKQPPTATDEEDTGVEPTANKKTGYTNACFARLQQTRKTSSTHKPAGMTAARTRKMQPKRKRRAGILNTCIKCLAQDTHISPGKRQTTVMTATTILKMTIKHGRS